METTATPRRKTGGRPRNGRPDPIDLHVGARLRLRRTLLGFSQEKLGEAVGLTFQQVQKYERGINRIGASRLYDLGRVLDVPMSFFFDDLDPGLIPAPAFAKANGRPAIGLLSFDADPEARQETNRLIHAYYRISDPTLRKRLFELTRAVATRNGGGR